MTPAPDAYLWRCPRCDREYTRAASQHHYKCYDISHAEERGADGMGGIPLVPLEASDEAPTNESQV